uniref:Uncharacterized protein n=1 Tax=Arundo donax TaxID=35708 RepID=A0A0A8YZU1_ARUDO
MKQRSNQRRNHRSGQLWT